MVQASTLSSTHRAMLILAFATSGLLVSACAGTTQGVEQGSSALSAPAQFDALFAHNLRSAEKHFWEVVDCEKRDEVNGMPTTKVPLPGATRTFLESAEYNLYYFFPKEGLGQSDLHAFVRARMLANIPEGYSYTYESSPDSGDCTLSHEGRPDDFPSVELSEASGLLQITFFPAQNAEIPWGNPCAPRER